MVVPRLTRAAWLLLAGAPATASAQASRSAIAIETIATLHDSATHVLARPAGLVRAPDGTIYVADRSDRDVKIFSAAGARAGSAGNAKPPAGFSALGALGMLGGALTGFDLLPARACTVRPLARMGPCVTLDKLRGSAPIRFGAIDDSLILVTHSVLEGAKDPLVTLADARGTPRARFFQPRHYLNGDPKLEQFSGVAADGRDGVVFVLMIGGDSIWAYDYGGRRLGGGAIRGLPRDSTAKALLARNHGADKLPDGRWVVDGQRRAFAVAALPGREAFVQIARFDGVRGIDPVQGGDLVLIALDAAGQIRTIETKPVHAGLFGSEGAAALLLGAGAGPGQFVLMRAAVTPAAGTGRVR